MMVVVRWRQWMVLLTATVVAFRINESMCELLRWIDREDDAERG